MDVLITHGPPKGVLDGNFGDKWLREDVREKSPEDWDSRDVSAFFSANGEPYAAVASFENNLSGADLSVMESEELAELGVADPEARSAIVTELQARLAAHQAAA